VYVITYSGLGRHCPAADDRVRDRAEHLAGVGDERRDDHHVPVRRRQCERDRDRRDGPDRHRAVGLAGRLPDDREVRVRQGRARARLSHGRADHGGDGRRVRRLDKTVTSFGSFTGGKLELAVLLGALAYAGAGGTNNLVVSNWIRDKGYGMGLYAPRVTSPITGEEEAAPSGRGYVFRVDPKSMERWREWWRNANIEQFRLSARAPALDREPALLPRRLDADRLRHRDPALRVRPAAVAGGRRRGAERRGDVHLLGAAAGDNRRFLPGPLKVRGLRLLVLLWATGLFGVMSVLVVINEAGG
jgi:hypothetical protein